MRYDILEGLRKLANTLDKNGFGKQADKVDGFLNKLADDLGDGGKALSSSRTEQIEEQVRQQIDGGPAPGTTEKNPVGMPGLKSGRSQLLSAEEIATEIDRNPSFKKAMLLKLVELSKLYMDMDRRTELGRYLERNKSTLNGQQIATMLSQMGFTGKEKK